MSWLTATGSGFWGSLFASAPGYLHLAQTYGGVQLVMTPVTGPDAHKGTKRSTLAQTYEQVGKDLDISKIF